MKKTILIICVAAACILFGLVAFIGLSGRNKNEEQQDGNKRTDKPAAIGAIQGNRPIYQNKNS